MKLLSRMIAVVVLLGVLAYGSYAFGMYVLSAKLFGDNVNSKSLRDVSRSTTEASAVTRQTGWKGAKPRVEVKVLPSEETGAGAPLPAYADEDGFQKQAPREGSNRRDSSSDADSQEPAPPTRLGKREFDSGSADYSLGEENKTSKRSSRRRHRSRSKPEEKKPEEAKPMPKPDDAQVSAGTATGGEERSGNSNSDSNSSRDNSNDSGSSGDRADISNKPRESSSETLKPREKSRRRNKSTRTKPRDSSPVPRPEGSRSSGGDSADNSPVPQPE